MIQNPQLEGDSFFWAGGPVGVVLSHGFTATTAEVRLLGRYLHERGYTVAGPLLPGHGTAPEDLIRCRWQEWSAALAAVYRQVAASCERVFVGGESMGALLALYVASEQPEVAGILTYAPALKASSRLISFAPVLWPFLKYITPPRDPDGVVDGRWKGYTVRPVRAAAQLLRLQQAVRPRLPAIRQPLLIVQGRLDRTVDLPAVEALYREIGSPVKEFHWMEESTHCVILDREWEAVAQLTENFMARVLGAAA